MATFDRLSGEQRAVLELALRGGHSYEELSGMLRISSARVQELAREALSELAPATAERVDPEWRGPVADYLLGQQSGPESEATRSHLERSEAARGWALSLVDSLDPLYANGARPVIPEPREAAGDGGAPAAPQVPDATGARVPDRVTDTPGRAGSAATVRRRRIASAAVVAAGLVAIMLAWFLLPGAGEQRAGGGAREPTPGTQPEGARAGGTDQRQVPFLASGELRPVRGQRGLGAAGVIEKDGQPILIGDVRVGPPGAGEVYVLWLYNGPGDAVAVGVLEQITRGVYQGFGQLPRDYQRFRFVDLSREREEILDDRGARHSGNSVLRGELRASVQPGQLGQGGRARPPGSDAAPGAAAPPQSGEGGR